MTIPRHRLRLDLALVTLAALLLPACAGGIPAATGPLELEPTVILISFDGFRWDHMVRADTPTFDRMASEGVQARGLIPVYPSKTFPSHYSIATGLYPGRHGILSNHMRDATLGAEFHLADREQVERTDWWGGEPIWATAERQGLTTATLFWPGSEAEVAGTRPTYWERYDQSLAWHKRVAQAIKWLELPEEERPRLVTLYFEEPNDAGHRWGPEAPETIEAVQSVDAILGSLVEALEDRRALDQVNLILVSDHGMAEVGEERTIYVDDLVTFEEGEVFETGALLQVFPNPGRESLLYAGLAGAHPNLRVFRSGEIPDEYHLRDNPRIAPIWGIPDVGWEVTTREGAAQLWGRGLRGDHGQDPFHQDMHGLFVARGPAFAQGVVVDAFENVHVYSLMAHALGLSPAETDGSLDAVRDTLRTAE